MNPQVYKLVYVMLLIGVFVIWQAFSKGLLKMPTSLFWSLFSFLIVGVIVIPFLIRNEIKKQNK